ncbi:M56 family metallopeptidase [Undibacterium fentianense]|uniref:M48 family metalloprotease n=1 Tax=Undibacterium fentianense TaxID=2828728 RepID=A0A941E189_9BURK|nr:M56 family metallopeptidase [Undibacterium fentianense]MBR7800545.1 M48 family metalloprotease [Undibacterium fentianense]
MNPSILLDLPATLFPNLQIYLQDWIAVIGMALLHFVWQGAALFVFTAIALRVLRREHSPVFAQARYILALGALLLCVCFPLSYVIQHAPSTSTFRSGSNAEFVSSLGSIPRDEEAAHKAHALGPAARTIAPHTREMILSCLPYLFAAWILGMLVFLLRFVLGLRWVSKQIDFAHQDRDPIWSAKLQSMASAMGMQRRIRFGVSDHLEFPVTAGWWRPIVIFPSALLSGMPVELVEALLAHEVAHIKRWDYLVNLFQSLIEIVLFYHPVVWWLSKQIRIEREQIADDLAASMLGEPRRLALALSELERFQFIHPQLAQVAHGGQLMLRIKRLTRAMSTAQVSTVATAGWKVLLPALGLSATCIALYAQANAPTSLASTASAELATNSGTAPEPSMIGSVVSSPVETPSLTSISMLTEESSAPAPLDRQEQRNKVQKEENATNFALIRPRSEHSTFVRSSKAGLTEIERLKKNNQDEFLWFSEKGQSYVIKDKAILEQANAAYQPLEVLGQEMEQHGKKMEQHGEVMEKIGAQMEAVQLDHKAIDATVEKAMRVVEKKMQGLEKKLEAAAEKVANAQSDQARQHALEALAKEQARFSKLAEEMQKNQKEFHLQEQDLQRSLQPLEELSKKMAEASKPMEALGAQMDQLGKKMEGISKEAERKIQELIQSAKQRGLAKAVSEV